MAGYNKYLKSVNSSEIYLVFFMIFIVGSFAWFFVRQLFMQFEKEIIVKDKYIKNSGRSSNKIIVDEENNTYILEDAILLGDMNSLDDYNKIEKGKRYKISGSGLRNRFFSLFPVVYKVEEI